MAEVGESRVLEVVSSNMRQSYIQVAISCRHRLARLAAARAVRSAHVTKMRIRIDRRHKALGNLPSLASCAYALSWVLCRRMCCVYDSNYSATLTI
jgi:hypothetical protein